MTPAALADSSARVTAGRIRRRGAASHPLAHLRREPGTVAGPAVLIVLLGVAVAAPLIVAEGPLVQDRQSRFLPPSLRHPFGTDEFGRDLWSRTVYGARVSLFTGGAVVLLASTVGVPLGLLGGYAAGWTDAVVMRLLDSLLAVPAILLAMGIIAVLGQHLPDRQQPRGGNNVPKAYVDAIAEASSTVDPAKQKAAFAKLNAAILDEAWVISIAYRQSVFGLAKHVDGFAFTVDDMPVLENVSLEKS